MKKIFISILPIFVFSTLFCNVTSAQTIQGITVATVNISNARIITQKDRDFVIYFDISNRVGAQPQVEYSVRLSKFSTTSELTVDEKVYGDVLSLGENTKISKNIQYDVPNAISGGNYHLWIDSKNSSGLPLGVAYLGEVKIKEDTANRVEIIPDSCYFITTSGQAPINKGIVIDPDNTFSVKCQIKSSFPTNVTLTPDFITRNHTIFGEVSSTTEESIENIIIKNGLNEVTLTLPKAPKPQDYYLSFSLVSNDSKIISNIISFNYTLSGQTGTIQNVVFDKDSYKAGDIAKLQIFSTQNGSSTITILESDNKGTACASSSNKEIPSFSVVNMSILITRDCVNPKAEVFLVAGDKVLDSHNFQIETTTSHIITSQNIIILSIFILGLIIFVIFYKNKKSKNKHSAKLLIFILILFVEFSVLNVSSTMAIGRSFPPPMPPPAPTIGAFTYSPDPILYNGVASIYATSSGVTSCTLTGNGNTIVWNNTTNSSFDMSALSGNLTSDTTFSLACTNSGGTVTSYLTIPLVSVSILSSGSAVSTGGSTMVSWNSHGTTYCDITKNGVLWSASSTSGSKSSGALTIGTAFIIRCGSPTHQPEVPVYYKHINFTAYDSYVSILVSPIVTVSTSVSSTSVTSGSSIDFSWSVSGNKTCKLTANGTEWLTNTKDCYGNPIVLAENKNSCNGAWNVDEVGGSPDYYLNVDYYTFGYGSGAGVNCGQCISGPSNTYGPISTTTTFVLSCANTLNSATSTSIVSIYVPVIPVTTNIAASSSVVSLGNSTTLSWTSTGADSCEIKSDNPMLILSTSKNGSMSTGPINTTTTFTIKCQNVTSSSTQFTTITTEPLIEGNGLPITVSLNSASPSVFSGSSTIITWSSQNADSCELKKSTDQNWSAKSLSSSVDTGPLTATTTFTLLCTSSSTPLKYTYNYNNTYKVPEGVNSITVEVEGGGGNGGPNACWGCRSGGGGGGGGYGKQTFDVNSGDIYSVTVGGASQASIFGTLIIANGGVNSTGYAGGAGGTSNAAINSSGQSGGTAGAPTAAHWQPVFGVPGVTGYNVPASIPPGASGGVGGGPSAGSGGGGNTGATWNGAGGGQGSPGTAPGGGGGGSASGWNGQVGGGGGAGAKGRVVITSGSGGTGINSETKIITVSVIVLKFSTTTTPTNLFATPNNCNINLSWSSSESGDTFKIYKDGVSIATDIPDKFYNVTLSPGDTTVHTYYVVANNSLSGDSASSNSVPAKAIQCTVANQPISTSTISSTCIASQGTSTIMYVGDTTRWTVLFDISKNVASSSVKSQWIGNYIAQTGIIPGFVLDKVYSTVGLKFVDATTTGNLGDASSTPFISHCYGTTTLNYTDINQNQ